MKNITVSLDDETYRRARMIAAQRDTSVSALVRRFLLQLASGESETERLKRQERALRERVVAFRASDRLSRDARLDLRSDMERLSRRTPHGCFYEVSTEK
jgi:hypothetical protein